MTQVALIGTIKLFSAKAVAPGGTLHWANSKNLSRVAESMRVCLSLCGRDVAAQPDDEIFKGEGVRLVKPGDKIICGLGVRRDAHAIDREKSIGRGEGDPLIAVDEGMVLREAFPEGRRLLDQVGVIARLGPEKGGFQQARIAHAGGSAVALYLVVVDGEHFGEGEIVRHSASFL